jgi:chromosome segregation ATPase
LIENCINFVKLIKLLVYIKNMALFGGSSTSGAQDAQNDLRKQEKIQRLEGEIKRFGGEQSRRMADIQRLRDENGRKRQDVMRIQKEIADNERRISEIEELNRHTDKEIKRRREEKDNID